MQTQFQLGSYIHACTNETHSLANLQDLANPYFGRHNYRQHKLAKVELNLVDLLENVFYLCMQAYNYSAGIVFA